MVLRLAPTYQGQLHVSQHLQEPSVVSSVAPCLEEDASKDTLPCSRSPCTDPISGRNGPEVGRTWTKNGGPTGKRGQKWPENGKTDSFDPFFGSIFPFSAIFSHFSVGPKSIFGPFFSSFRAPKNEMGSVVLSVQGNRDRNPQFNNMH